MSERKQFVNGELMWAKAMEKTLANNPNFNRISLSEWSRLVKALELSIKEENE